MKNKKLFTRALSLMICMIMVLGSVALGNNGVSGLLGEIRASAADYEYVTFPIGNELYMSRSNKKLDKDQSAETGGHGSYAFDFCNGTKDLKAPFTGKVVYKETKDSNTIIFQSKDKVRLANGKTDYVSIVFAHDNDISDVVLFTSSNQKYYKQGEVFYQQGTYMGGKHGGCGQHSHIEVAIGQYSTISQVRAHGVHANEAFFIPDSVKITKGYIYESCTGKTIQLNWTRLSTAAITSELEMFLNDSLYNYAYNSDFATLDKEHYRTRNSSKYELSVDPSEKIDGYNSLKIKALEAGADQKDLIIGTQLQNSNQYGNAGEDGIFIVSFFAKSDVPGAKMYWRWGEESDYDSVQLSTDWEHYSVVLYKKPEYNSNLHPYIDKACTVWINQFQVAGDVFFFKPDSGKKVSTIQRKYGQKYGSLPTPTLTGYSFAGWFDRKYGGTQITSTTSAGKNNLRVYAHWNKIEDYNVTLYNNYSEKNYISLAGDNLNENINKYLFSRDSSLYRVTADNNLFQGCKVIKAEGLAVGSAWPKDMCLRTDTNSSTKVKGTGDSKSMILSFYAKAEKAGTKLYWRWGYASDLEPISLSTEWKRYSINIPKSADFSESMLLYFDTVGTVWLSQLQLEDGDAATDYVPETSGIFDEFTYSGSFSSSTLSSYVPVREGYDFDGWYTSKVGGAKVTSSNDVALGDVKLYAHWSKSACKHNYVVVADTEPTCLNDGSRTFKCSKCGDSYVEAVPAPGHKAGEWTVETAATCTAAGKRVKYCTVCRAVVETETLPAKGHSFGEWKQGAASSCTADGYEYRVCASCGFVENKNVSGTGHSWASEYTVDKAATCTENGSKSIHCTKCTATTNSTVIPAKGHSFGNWRTLNEATCTADGSEIRNCSACSATEKRTVAAKGHIWQDDFTVDKEATCSETGSKSVHCRNCSATKYSTEIAKKPHNVVIDNSVSATCTTAGLTEGSHCLTCGTVIKARTTVPATGHTDMNNDGLCDKCGKSLAPTVYPKLSIRTPSTTTVSYGFTLNLHANVTDLPEGARVVWSMDGSGFELIPSSDGMTCGVKSVSKGSATITAKVVDKTGNAVKDANGNEITASQQLTSKAGFFQKLAAFFKRLFGSNMVTPYALNKLMK